jgi:hypothetical protein
LGGVGWFWSWWVCLFGGVLVFSLGRVVRSGLFRLLLCSGRVSRSLRLHLFLACSPSISNCKSQIACV